MIPFFYILDNWFVGDENNRNLNNLFQKLFCSPSKVPISTRIILRNTIQQLILKQNLKKDHWVIVFIDCCCFQFSFIIHSSMLLFITMHDIECHGSLTLYFNLFVENLFCTKSMMKEKREACTVKPNKFSLQSSSSTLMHNKNQCQKESSFLYEKWDENHRGRCDLKLATWYEDLEYKETCFDLQQTGG